MIRNTSRFLAPICLVSLIRYVSLPCSDTFRFPALIRLFSLLRYVPGAAYHSVMYKASDVVHPGSGDCASQRLHDHGGLHYHTKYHYHNTNNIKPDKFKEHKQSDLLNESDPLSSTSATQSRSIHPKLLVTRSNLRHREQIRLTNNSNTSDPNNNSNNNNNIYRYSSDSIRSDIHNQSSFREYDRIASDARGPSEPLPPAAHVFHTPFFQHTRRKR